MKIERKHLIAIITLVVIIAVGIIIYNSTHTLKCTINNKLIKGFSNEEKVVFKLNSKEITKIKVKRTVTLSDYYDKYGTYYDSLEKVLDNGYKYLGKGKYKISKKNKSVILKVKTKDKGMVLKNLTIRSNSETDDTSLRFDILNDIKNDDNAFNIGDKYTRKELSKKVKSLGYECN